MKLKRIAMLLMLLSFAVCIVGLCACTDECEHLVTIEQLTKEPTCTESGLKNVVCQDCEIVLQEGVVVPAIGHSQTTTDQVTKNPTCTEAGSKNVICSVCNQAVQTDVAIPATGHSQSTTEQVVVEATCSKKGSKNILCDDCGQVVATVEIPKIAHTYGSWTVITEPTTTYDGLRAQSCIHCQTQNQEAIPQLNEINYDYAVTRAPTCKDTGIATYTSTVYGAFQVVLPKSTEHSKTDENVTLSATCTTDGSKQIICSLCKAVLETQSIKAQGHKFANATWVLTTEPTLTQVGIAYRQCDNCSHKEYDNAVAVLTDTTVWTRDIDHADFIPATHTTNGLDVYVSHLYGEVKVATDKLTEHEYNNSTWKLTTEPTFDTTGVAKRKCDGCDYIEQNNDVAVLADTSVWTKDDNHADHKEPNCTGGGIDVYLSVYGTVKVSTEKLNHEENSTPILVKAETCTVEGEQKYVCLHCNATLRTEVIPAKGHGTTYTQRVEATCTQDGTVSTICNDCKSVIKTEKLTASGHAYGEWTLTMEPTTSKDGSCKQVCANSCGLDNVKAIPMLDEVNYTVERTTSTCAVAGTAVYTSKQIYVGETPSVFTVALPKVDHTSNPDKDGYCLVCDTKYYTTGLVYELSADGTYYIIPSGQHYITDSNGEIIIPAYYKGLPVREIAGDAFVNKDWIKTVVIPETITTIRAGAFRDTSLTDIYFNAINCNDFDGRNWVFIQHDTSVAMTVHIGPKVERIPARMFFPLVIDPTSAPNLVNIVFAENGALKYIGDYAFYLTNLTNVTIPDTVTTIGDYAFAYTKLTSFTSGANVTTIGNNAFMGCTSLKSIAFNDKLQSLGNDVFNNCNRLVNVDLSNTKVTTLGVDAFKLCSSLTQIKLPQTLTKIEDSAFEGCTKLTGVQLPQELTYVGKNAFLDCSSLAQITIPNKVTFIGNGAFQNCSSLAVVNYNATNCADFEQGNMIFANLANGLTINVGDNVERIPARFLYCSANASQIAKVVELSIGSGVKSIGDYAFLAVEIQSATYNGSSTEWQQVLLGVENDALDGIVTGGNV